MWQFRMAYASVTIRAMADFKFIVLPELRRCLESDYRELRECLRVEAWKAVHVLAGSIVEAVLIDALGPVAADPTKLDTLELGPLIALAKDHRILPDEAVELSTVIRKYRNLIHPGRVKRLEKVVDRSGAVVAAEVVEIIVGEVCKRKRETFGFTAEQLLDRLRGGASALVLVPHLVADTPKPELTRLLVSVIPAEFIGSLSDLEMTMGDSRHLADCYRRVFDSAPEDVKTKAANNMYRVFKQEHEGLVIAYEQFLLHASDLAYLSEPERELVKTHLLQRLSSETIGALLGTLTGIGPFLCADDIFDFALAVLPSSREDCDIGEGVRRMLMIEFPNMKEDCRKMLSDMAVTVGDQKLMERLNARVFRLQSEMAVGE